MIKKIVLKDIATFDSTGGGVIDNLQRVNFVYGGNDCGKTTLSRVLEKPRGTEKRDNEPTTYADATAFERGFGFTPKNILREGGGLRNGTRVIMVVSVEFRVVER